MPLRQAEDLRLTAEEKREASLEVRNAENRGLILYSTVQKVTKCMEIVDYIINPRDKQWDKLLRAMEIVSKCWRRWQVYKKKEETQQVPELPVIGGKVVVLTEKIDHVQARKNIFRKTSAELVMFEDKKAYENLGEWQDNIFIYKGRILDCSDESSLATVSMDLLPRTFANPVVSRKSPIATSIMMYAHEKLTHHGTAVATLRRSLEIAYIIQGRSLAIEVRNNCYYCRRYKAKMIQAEMSPIHSNRLTPAPAFYLSQVDLFGPFEAACEHNHRSTVKVYGLVFKCCATMSIWIEVMQNYSSDAFLQAYTRFVSRFAHPGQLLIDQGSQLLAACKKAEISFTDLAKTINGKNGVPIEFSTCPVGAHEGQGQVERSIREIRKLLDAVFRGLKLDILGYATAFAYISSELNSLPIGLGSKYKNLDNLDLLTPNRLIMGRNVSRAPQGMVEISKPQRLQQQMEKVCKAWWATWDKEWIINLIPCGNKWRSGNPDIDVGRIVVFKREGKDSSIGKTPVRIGRVLEIHKSKDGIIRSAVIEYRNADEKVFRTTTRSVRTVGVIYPEEVLEFPNALNKAEVAAQNHLMEQQLSREKFVSIAGWDFGVMERECLLCSPKRC